MLTQLFENFHANWFLDDVKLHAALVSSPLPDFRDPPPPPVPHDPPPSRPGHEPSHYPTPVDPPAPPSPKDIPPPADPSGCITINLI